MSRILARIGTDATNRLVMIGAGDGDRHTPGRVGIGIVRHDSKQDYPDLTLHLDRDEAAEVVAVLIDRYKLKVRQVERTVIRTVTDVVESVEVE